MKPRLIVIDGKTYNSVDEMPENVRKQYEQAMGSMKDPNGNRIPDAFENNNMLADQNQNGMPDILENTAGAPIFMNAMKILVDGKEFKNLDDLPPEARAKYEKAMGALDANRNGIPDFVEGLMGSLPQQTTSTPASTVSPAFGTETPRIPTSPPIPVTPTITPDTSNGWMLALLGVFLLLVCALAAFAGWYFFLR